MKNKALILSVTLLTSILGLTGCSNNVSSGNPSQTNVLSNGWYYTDLSALGDNAQIAGLKSSNGVLDLEAEYSVIQGLEIQSVYKSAPVQLIKGTFGIIQSDAPPSGYRGAWSLKFGTLQYTKPIQITLVHKGKDVFTLPTSVPGYADEIMTDPAPFDNQVIGESGQWVWIAMKGPQNPPFPQMINGFRYWNRIVAINTQTDELHVYSIPPNTSSVSTESNAPAFAQVGQTVYIGTGSWVGVFPSQPSSNSMKIVRSEPQSIVSQDQQKMLSGLQNEVNVGANGLAKFWNGYIMDGNQQDNVTVWVMDPAYWNHGYLPEGIIWAGRFPLKQGISAYKARQQLFGEIEVLLKNPLDTAWIALDTRLKMKTHFHSNPPAQIPGYIIKGGYYEKAGTQAGVYVFSQPILKAMYATVVTFSVGPIFPPQEIINKTRQWAPKVSTAMLPYVPSQERALDRQIIEAIHGKTSLKTLPGYVWRQYNTPVGGGSYLWPINDKWPKWVDPIRK